jgi:hypothetical protein
MLQNDRSAELRDCFKQSYDIVLKHHYTFVINGPVSVSATSFCRTSILHTYSVL